ncbi:MAG TPA: ATP-binding cassette domain-containing protein, partial [Methylomirabilota bacterium]|nr:ATP-binding cassette domain-containing protein [Methylomirabilota bacterium]
MDGVAHGLDDTHSANDAFLEIEDVHLAFGGVRALRGVGFRVQRGQIFSLIGPNGAGKTVLLNCINGLYQPQRGRILFEGRDLVGLKPYRRAALGISRTFQKIELFGGMTVLDNIRL